jgi:hypothetical protein
MVFQSLWLSERATHRRLGFQSGAFLEECPRGTNVPFHPVCRVKALMPGQIDNFRNKKKYSTLRRIITDRNGRASHQRIKSIIAGPS